MDIYFDTYQTFNYRPKQLSEFIDCFTIYNFTDDQPVKLQPEGNFELIFQMGNNFSQSPMGMEGWESRPKQFIGGLHSQSYYIKPNQKGSALISVKFKASQAKHFIPDKLNLFKNRVIGLSDVFKHDSLSNLEQLNYSSGYSHAIDLIESFLIQVFREPRHSSIDHAISVINHKQGFVLVNELAKIACLSDSQFRKRFNEEIGMSPKEYCKIIRIKKISEQLSGQTSVHLTRLGYDLGYFDQSHFIKDFKSVTGTTPKKYLS